MGSRRQRVGRLMRFVFAQRLEGSRFTTYPYEFALFASTLDRAKKALTSGSRERPTGLQLFYRSGVNEILGHRANGSRRDVPGSRLISHVLVGLALKRMLRGGRDTRQSGSPPDVGSCASTLRKNE
jgi:hypothetical protein